MKIKSINQKLLSILLAATLSLTSTLVSAETNEEKYKTSSIISEFNEDTSIFSDQNINSNQYGADQTDLDEHAISLLGDELIMEELQKYFPISIFKTEYDARDFYIAYLKIISDCGCGYAVAIDAIFQAFEGQEKEFEEIFGFPMYRTYGYDKKDYNYELLILKFFNFYNIDKLHHRDQLYYSIIDQEEEKINELKKLTGYSGITPPGFKEWTREKKSQWLTESFERQREFEKLYDEWKKTYKEIDDDFYFGIPAEQSFGYLREFLKKYNIQCSISFTSRVRDYNTGDIIASENFDLYELNEYGNIIQEKDDVELHYLYVVGKTSDGEIIVSSWGSKYIFDDTNAKNDSKIIIKIRR